MRKVILFVVFFSSAIISANAQDLLSMLDSSSIKPKSEKVFATFKTTKVINAQSTETVKKRTLDFRITHRFGNIGEDAGGGFHNLYGFDNIADVRLSFDYGITDKLQIGLGRSKRQENLDGTIKWRFLEQTTDNKIPLTLALYANTAFTPMAKDAFYTGTINTKEDFAHRFSYVTQLIIARKFNRFISVALLPTYQHRNFVKGLINSKNNKQEDNSLFSLGIAARVKVSQRVAILMDYFHTFSDYRNDNPTIPYYNPLALGIEIDTGGHIFHLNLTNATGILENDFIPNTNDTWTNGGFKFGFNISRVFNF